MFLTASRPPAGYISRCAAQKRKRLTAATEVVFADLLPLALISGRGILLFDYAECFGRSTPISIWAEPWKTILCDVTARLAESLPTEAGSAGLGDQ